MGQGPDREMAEELGPHEVITEACPLPKLSLLGHEGTEVTSRRLSAPSPFKPGCTSEPDCSLPAPGLERAFQPDSQLRVLSALQGKGRPEG